jgi:alpha-methylacyl-CoA racemase
LGVAQEGDFARQHDRALWPALKQKLAGIIAQKTRAEWCAIFDGSDACVAPVLTLAEAPRDPHNAERGTFIEVDGIVQPRPAPRFSATAAPDPAMPNFEGGTDTPEVLRTIGYSDDRIESLKLSGAVL